MSTATLQDRAGITDAVARYVMALDTRDFVALRQCLTDDATARYGSRPELVGADAIVAALTEITAGYVWQQHIVGVEYVEVDGERATARASMQAFERLTAEPHILLAMVGRYRLSLRRAGAEWLLSALTLRVDLVERRTL